MMISFAVTAKLICVFVFAYAKRWFSHDAAQSNLGPLGLGRILLCIFLVYQHLISKRRGFQWRWFLPWVSQVPEGMRRADCPFVFCICKKQILIHGSIGH